MQRPDEGCTYGIDRIVQSLRRLIPQFMKSTAEPSAASSYPLADIADYMGAMPVPAGNPYERDPLAGSAPATCLPRGLPI